MSINDYENDKNLIWQDDSLIDKFREYLRQIHETTYNIGEKNSETFFKEFYPIWLEYTNHSKPSPDVEVAEKKNFSTYMRAKITIIKGRRAKKDKAGERNITMFLAWMAYYQQDHARIWYDKVKQHYVELGRASEVEWFKFRPYKGSPPSFQDTDLYKKWNTDDIVNSSDIGAQLSTPKSKAPLIVITAVVSLILITLASTQFGFFNTNTQSAEINTSDIEPTENQLVSVDNNNQSSADKQEQSSESRDTSNKDEKNSDELSALQNPTAAVESETDKKAPVVEERKIGSNDTQQNTASETNNSNTRISPESNLPRVRIFTERIEARDIQSILNNLNVKSQIMSRKICLQNSPATAIWPDQSVDFGEFKSITIKLIDAGYKFYVIHPKFRKAHNTIDVGSIVNTNTCTIDINYPPFSREEIIAAKYFCGGFRPSINTPVDDAQWINETCFYDRSKGGF